MAGGGFGSLQAMINTIKSNRALLRKKRGFETLKEHQGQSKIKRVYKFKKASKEDLTEINQRMKLRNKNVLIKQIILFSVLGIIFSFLMYAFFFTPSKQTSSLGKPMRTEYYSTQMKPLGNNMYLKVEYFDMSNVAAETKIKNGFKHQQSESFYPNGRQFRSAVYWYDTLINEVYFAPTGDTLKHSVKWHDKEPIFIRLKGYDQNEYTFYCSEGKIIPGTFKM
ncbi:hypothetical protein [Fulvivirga lutea]|uniref:Uncharacterized protein n=1 Tax=Fulvivirga lutea TaxID=2810512 RepID=A0A974WIJ6_9BACT|nr:hypothetical protein [Fulvivirga lutea]QSE98554.1 hypothetical protein JR347_05595 [Fulvivirga lutea]